MALRPGDGATAPPPSRRWTVFSWPVRVLALVTALAWAPVASVFLAYLLARHFGCQVNEARAQPCPAWGGADIGGPLHTMAVMGWLMLATAPVILVTAIAWAGLLARFLFRRFRSRRPPGP